ncbi:MAG TPA: radical SAM protein [Candidatus Omnitrophota bacterium]|nr:radical SAM protein [Candidatus Omnitrophota bacterium]
MNAKRRILLIEPPFYRLFKETYSLDKHPLSLGYLAGAIRNETDWDVLIYNADFKLDRRSLEPFEVSYLSGKGFEFYREQLRDLSKPVWDEVRAAITQYAPEVVGISAKSQNFKSACLVARLAKEINPQTIVVVGGPHATLTGKEILAEPHIDLCVRGEGERTIVELLRAVEEKKSFGGIHGVAFRENGRIAENPPREFIPDLDSLVPPHETAPQVLKDYEKYPRSAFRCVLATRGCPHNCFFCGSRGIWGPQVRFRSPENVAREARRLQEKGLEWIHFDDDLFGANPRYLRELCGALIARCPGLKWSCELHVNLVTEETVPLMKRAGCYLIQMGVESGNDGILKKIRKGYSAREALAACRIIRKYGLQLWTLYMVGFPWETPKTIRDTMRVMKKSGSDLLVYSIFTPYQGTEAFAFCRENGLIGESFDPSLYYHQSPANCFCLALSPAKFRKLVSGIERMVDRENLRGKASRPAGNNFIKRISSFWKKRYNTR